MSSIKTVNININANELFGVADKNNKSKNPNGKNRGSINGADLNFGGNLVEKKRNAAMKKAVAALNKTFDKDLERDKELSGRQDRIDELKLLIRDAYNSMGDTDKKLADLKEEYEIDDAGSEQKELELLMKRVDSENSGTKLTDEELAKLDEIDKKGLTEYQERAIQAYEAKSVNNRLVEDYEKELNMGLATLQAAKIDDLKQAPMIDSRKEADSILEAARKEIIGDIVDESKKHIEEKFEEEKEKAEKAKEEKEKLEELINKRKEEKDITEEIPLEEYNKADNIRQEIEAIVKDTGLSQEDMLGLAINQQA